jgi:homoserine dehydrogenase
LIMEGRKEVLLMGTGKVASEAARQLVAGEHPGLHLRGMVHSGGFALHPELQEMLDLEVVTAAAGTRDRAGEYLRELEGYERSTGGLAITQKMLSKLEPPVFPDMVLVDASDAGALPSFAAYNQMFMGMGAVATANKSTLVGDNRMFMSLTSLPNQFGYAATVMAGTGIDSGSGCVLDLVSRLRDTDDDVLRVSASLSGTLGYVGWKMDQAVRTQGPSSSDIWEEVMDLGYTEPNPAVDASGADGTGKVVNIARTSGYPVVAQSVKVESFLPSECLEGVTDAASFMTSIRKVDEVMWHRFEEVAGRGEVLRYVANLDFDNPRSPSLSIGFRSFLPEQPMAQLEGTTNLAVVETRKGKTFAIQGPGAGPEPTARNLLKDAARLPGDVERIRFYEEIIKRSQE